VEGNGMWKVGIYRAMGERELRDIIKFIKSQRLRWAAHVMRIENTKTTKKSTRMDAI
jgi:histone acetyltransferase (RNA polymerase elongator complex component)